uniref:Ribosomal RNA-processing protein 8 n=1 Tax=Blastobotrys adeninivorans TaxID=409370 RepID=A0A060TD75_BLAAD
MRLTFFYLSQSSSTISSTHLPNVAMSLFQVEGWNLPSQVAKEDLEKKKKKNDEKKKNKKNRETTKNADLTEEVPTQKADVPKKRKRKDEVTKKSKEESTPESSANIEPVSTQSPVEKKDEKRIKLTPMQQKMQQKLMGSRFRWINEQLYTLPSEKALDLIKQHPSMFEEYHSGFRHQVQSWPQNPIDTFVDVFKQRLDKPIAAPGGLPGDKDGQIIVADMGCGEAQLSLHLQKVKGHGRTKKAKFVVHSFDLKKANDRITVADIKNVPLEDESAHVVVFCLALMGTNFLDFIREGLRILKPRGEIWIAEIKSRFVEQDFQKFVNVLKTLGLLHKTTDDSNKMFVRFEFFKPPKEVVKEMQDKKKQRLKFIEQETEQEEGPEGKWLLKPCIYKRR